MTNPKIREPQPAAALFSLPAQRTAPGPVDETAPVAGGDA